MLKSHRFTFISDLTFTVLEVCVLSVEVCVQPLYQIFLLGHCLKHKVDIFKRQHIQQMN